MNAAILTGNHFKYGKFEFSQIKKN